MVNPNPSPPSRLTPASPGVAPASAGGGKSPSDSMRSNSDSAPRRRQRMSILLVAAAALVAAACVTASSQSHIPAVRRGTRTTGRGSSKPTLFGRQRKYAGDGSSLESPVATLTNASLVLGCGAACLSLSCAYDPLSRTHRLDVERADGESAFFPASGRSTPIEGVFGIYDLPSGPHAALITGSEMAYAGPSVGNRTLCEIRRVSSMEIVRIPGGSPGILGHAARREEGRQVRLLRRALRAHDFYYGAGRNTVLPDFTHALQRRLCNGVSDGGRDARFYWNEALVRPLLGGGGVDGDETVRRLAIPCTSASVGVARDVPLPSLDGATVEKADLLLVSRRSRFRVGTRFTVRGADGEGHVANFAETEQLLIVLDDDEGGDGEEEREDGGKGVGEKSLGLREVYSHVQIRGSIPLAWSSPTDGKTYTPRVRIGTDPVDQARRLRAHLAECVNVYGPGDNGALPTRKIPREAEAIPTITFVDLVDGHGDQGRLGRHLGEVLAAVVEVHSRQQTGNKTWHLPPGSVRHVRYDFHAETGGGRWHRLADLVELVMPELVGHGCASASPDGDGKLTLRSVQTGTLRTNCMDCLDRTNVAQAAFGRHALFAQLQRRGAGDDASGFRRNVPLRASTAFRRNTLRLPWPEGEQAFRTLWADNADAISRLYAGTRALKGDFTRTGVRTKMGALDDGANSVKRFYINNYEDAERLEAYELMTGVRPFSGTGEEEWPADGEGGGTGDANSDAGADAGASAALRWPTGRRRGRGPVSDPNLLGEAAAGGFWRPDLEPAAVFDLTDAHLWQIAGMLYLATQIPILAAAVAVLLLAPGILGWRRRDAGEGDG